MKMPGTPGGRPEQQKLLRPFLLMAPLAVSLAAAVPAGAQISMIWPEAARLLQPDGGMAPEADDWRAPGLVWPGSSDDPVARLRDGRTGITLRRRHLVTYREEHGGALGSDLGSRQDEVRVRVPLGPAGWRLAWGGERTGAVTALDVSDGRGAVDRRTADRHTMIALTGAGRRWDMYLEAGSRAGLTGSAEGAFALRWSPGREWGITLWATSRAVRDRFALRWDDALADIEAPERLRSGGLILESAPGGWFLRVRLQQSWGTSRGSVPGGHRLRSRPDLTRTQVGVRSPDGRWGLRAGGGWGTHGFDLDYLGLRYSQLLLDDHRQWVRLDWQPASQVPNYVLRAGYVRSALGARGVVEFWPFTPTIVDLLGLRRNMEGEAGLSDLTFGFGWRSIGGRLNVAVDLHDVRTRAELTSWEPVVLGLGRQNILTTVLAVDRLLLLDVGARSVLIRHGALELESAVAQTVPLRVYRRVPSSGGGGGGGGSGRRMSGGLRWELILRMALGTGGQSS